MGFSLEILQNQTTLLRLINFFLTRIIMNFNLHLYLDILNTSVRFFLFNYLPVNSVKWQQNILFPYIRILLLYFHFLQNIAQCTILNTFISTIFTLKQPKLSCIIFQYCYFVFISFKMRRSNILNTNFPLEYFHLRIIQVFIF